MSKYAPLWAYVKEHEPSAMTFAEIQSVCGFPIDHAFLRFKKELEAEGFRVEKILIKEEKVLFRKI